MFKVRDRVRIRKWDDMEREFGLDSDGDINCRPFFTREMEGDGLCGRTATIIDIYANGLIELDFDDESGDIDWKYSTAMLEPLIDKRVQVTNDVSITFEDMFDVLVDIQSRLDAPNALKELARVAYSALCKMKKYLKHEDDVEEMTE